MNKPKLIIVEGGQGTGKGTFTTLLREKMPYTTLMRLSGIKDKSDEGRKKVNKLRQIELRFLLATRECETNYVLDRSFITEKVYCNLGYKDYDFKAEYSDLLEWLGDIAEFYDAYVILLTTDKDDYEQRLKRDKATYEHSKFSVANSMRQQEEYFKEVSEIWNNYENITCAVVKNDRSVEEVFDEIARICNIQGVN